MTGPCTSSRCLVAIGALAALAALPARAEDKAAPTGLTVRHDRQTGAVTIAQGGTPVLSYRFATVPVPDRVKGKKYAEARSDYIHPLHGPAGEVLTADYPTDHPHHRGVYWAWPEVYYKGQKRDLHALQGVFARPGRLVRAEGGPKVAVIEAESVWKWGDTEPIVNERALIRAHAADPDGGRSIDLEFRITALVDGVALARRGQGLYGGLNLRSTLHGGQKIAHHTGPPGAAPRRNWGQIAGVPEGGKGPVAIAFLEHAGNPDYPGEWIQYPELAWLQPTFPAKGTKFDLSKDKPLLLRYRLWVRPGAATGEQLAAAWDRYNKPPEPAPAKEQK